MPTRQGWDEQERFMIATYPLVRSTAQNKFLHEFRDDLGVYTNQNPMWWFKVAALVEQTGDWYNQVNPNGMADRFVGYVANGGMGFAAGITFPWACPQTVLVDLDYGVPSLAHEIGHTYHWYALPPEEYSHYPPNGKEINDGITIYNTFLNRAEYLGDHNIYYRNRKWSFMGRPDNYNQAWVRNDVYADLFSKFKNVNDPEVLLIKGTIDKNDNANITSCYHFDSGIANDSMEGEYSLQSLSTSGVLLNTFTFAVPTLDPMPEKIPFVFLIPYHPDTQKIVIKHNDIIMKEITKSNNSPQVYITSRYENNGALNLSWIASDPDRSDELHFTVLYSHNNGNNWVPVKIDIPQNESKKYSFSYNVTNLPGGAQALWKVIATDNFNRAEAISLPFSVPDKLPTVEIASPIDGSEFLLGNKMSFRGLAYDMEDGELDASATWTSSIDGELGKRIPFEYSNLSLGSHVITLSVTDSAGKSVESTVNVTITENQNPDIAVTAIFSRPDVFIVGEESKITAKLFNKRVDAFCDATFYIDGTLIQKFENVSCVANDYTEVVLKWTPSEAKNYTISVELSNFNPSDEFAGNNYLEKTVKVIKRKVPFEEFNIKHWRIHWDQGKHDKNKFQLSGRIDLPDGYTLDMLQKKGVVTIAIEKKDSAPFSQTATLDFKQHGPIWHYKAPKAQNGTEPLDIEKMLIFWQPEGL
ncbi:MAG: hypothetical protein HY817_03875, partial [Candidatus Abawacabacteria bacterium]|nr:hypothetical protein [Candidatus Abawacabacteria bacterium]